MYGANNVYLALRLFSISLAFIQALLELRLHFPQSLINSKILSSQQGSKNRAFFFFEYFHLDLLGCGLSLALTVLQTQFKLNQQYP
jgi:hypothetical protein